jgi:hypothetical protein
MVCDVAKSPLEEGTDTVGVRLRKYHGYSSLWLVLMAEPSYPSLDCYTDGTVSHSDLIKLQAGDQLFPDFEAESLDRQRQQRSSIAEHIEA